MTEESIDATEKPVSLRGTPRKPYETPKLRVYGDVAVLTQAVGNMGTVADGGHGAMSKTS